MKKTLGDIIILHMHSKNGNHMMYVSWDIDCNGKNSLSFWTIFCPLTPLTAWKIKILKKWKKKHGDIIILQKCTINDNHMIYGSWDMKHERDNFLSFWTTVFCPFTPNNVKNQIFLKNEKTWRYHHFTIVYQESWSYAILFLRYGMWQM